MESLLDNDEHQILDQLLFRIGSYKKQFMILTNTEETIT